ncbi:MAG TPA: hypothetical protein PKW76_04560 [bacterium]|nr:hypothetical protein [bacterium]HPG44931.1 hypothetical protein [bacterium]HPM98040.1 hypothetical protein [bacterium]
MEDATKSEFLKAESLFNEGVKLYEKEDYQLAELKLTEALTILPKSEDIVYNLLLVYIKKEEYNKAWQFVEKIKPKHRKELIAYLEKMGYRHDNPDSDPHDIVDNHTLSYEEMSPKDAEVEAFKTTNEWFVVVQTADGQRRLCNKKQFKDMFRNDILDGLLNSESTVDVHVKTKEGQWNKTSSPLGQFARGYFKLRVLYEPVWSHAMAGLKWGALIGIGLKFLDTLILLGSADPTFAILFLVVAGVCAIPRIGIVAVVVVSTAMYKFTNANLFITLLSVILTGSILGCLPGMAIGGVVGLARKKSLPHARDAKSERDASVLKAVVLPLLGGAGLWALYLFVFNPWLMGVMSK